MSRIEELFRRKKKNILNVYFTAGFPDLNSTVPIMKSIQDAGADMVELGMPYSDPLADGPVIQHSSSIALANGMSIKYLLNQLKDFRKTITLPTILMGYLNPIMLYGFEKFCREISEIGIDGLILPDLPMFEFEQEFSAIIAKYKLDFIFLVTPETSEERIRKLDSLSSGFLYAVSSSATTGEKTDLKKQASYFNRLKNMNLKNPVLIGFGIGDKERFSQACSLADGAIVGTAFIRVLENSTEGERPAKISAFIKSLL